MENIYYPQFGLHVPVRDQEEVKSSVFGDVNKMDFLLEGREVFDTVCPVNPLTGHRDNPISILRYALTPANERLLDMILAELPIVREMDASDDVKLDMLVSRLDVGTFAENDFVFKRLEKVSSVLFPKDSEQAVKVAEQAIEFTTDDVVTKEE